VELIKCLTVDKSDSRSALVLANSLKSPKYKRWFNMRPSLFKLKPLPVVLRMVDKGLRAIINNNGDRLLP